jgi:tetratricopeptide (TPR) repeat protein
MNAGDPGNPPDRALASLKDAVARLAAGDASAALYAASEACRLAPALPQAHYAYGQAWTAMGDPQRAERAFAEAVRLQPDWPDAWVNYGLARYSQGAVEDAKIAMRHALAHAPGHPAATANLGALMRITGEPEGAEALLRATLAREPANAGARLNLAADLLQEERAAEALALLDAGVCPPEASPAGRHWRLQRALALLQIGRAEEAAAEVARLEALGPVPAEIAPLWRWRRVMIALAQGDARAAAGEALAMEAALGEMGPAAVPEHAIMARFDLAKFWSGQHQHARGFAQWVEGHKLIARSQPFSRPAHAALVEANIAHFSAARFAEGPRASILDAAPVFIVGMPRSGTTLAEQILAAHAGVHGAGERAALGQAFHALGGGDGAAAVARIAALSQRRLDEAAAVYLRDLHALAPGKARIVDKMPGNFTCLGLVGLMLPGAKIIHCLRDPRDVGLSIFTFRFHGAHPYAHDLADLGWYIGQHDRLMAHWQAALPNPILTLRLSDWVEDFDATLARVLDHVGLPSDPNCARFYESDSRVRTVSRAQVRQPVNARGLGRWKTYHRELAPLIQELEAAGGLREWV